MTTLQTLESQVGDHLVRVSDALDLSIRQHDPVILQALADITTAWNTLAVLVAAEARAKQHRLTFSAIHDGGSVIDAFHGYAVESFPYSLAAQAIHKAEGRP